MVREVVTTKETVDTDRTMQKVVSGCFQKLQMKCLTDYRWVHSQQSKWSRGALKRGWLISPHLLGNWIRTVYYSRQRTNFLNFQWSSSPFKFSIFIGWHRPRFYVIHTSLTFLNILTNLNVSKHYCILLHNLCISFIVTPTSSIRTAHQCITHTDHTNDDIYNLVHVGVLIWKGDDSLRKTILLTFRKLANVKWFNVQKGYSWNDILF